MTNKPNPIDAMLGLMLDDSDLNQEEVRADLRDFGFSHEQIEDAVKKTRATIETAKAQSRALEEKATK